MIWKDQNIIRLTYIYIYIYIHKFIWKYSWMWGLDVFYFHSLSFHCEWYYHRRYEIGLLLWWLLVKQPRYAWLLITAGWYLKGVPSWALSVGLGGVNGSSSPRRVPGVMFLCLDLCLALDHQLPASSLDYCWWCWHIVNGFPIDGRKLRLNGVKVYFLPRWEIHWQSSHPSPRCGVVAIVGPGLAWYKI